VLALSAAVVTSTGISGLGGALGSLFGYRASLAPPAQPAAALLPAPAVAPVTTSSVSPPRTRARSMSAHPRQRHSSGRGAPTIRPVVIPPPSAPPAVVPQHPSLPVPPPPPPATPTGTVQHAVESTVQAVVPVVPPAAPVADQVVATVDEACGLIGGCP